MEIGVSRRKFIQGVGAGLVSGFGLGGCASLVKVDSRDEASERCRAEFEAFPEANGLPGAGWVKKYWEEGATRCLVHVLQNHYGEDIPLDAIEMAWKTQRDIYDILLHLRKEKSDGERLSVYDEKVMFDNLLDRKKDDIRFSIINNILKSDNDPELVWTSSLYDSSLNDGIVIRDREFEIKIRELKIGAMGLLERDGHVVVMPASTEQANKIAYEELRKGIIGRALYDDRENVALRLMLNDDASHGGNMKYLVYGRRHAFGGRTSFPDYINGDRVSFEDNLHTLHEYTGQIWGLIEVIPKSLIIS